MKKTKNLKRKIITATVGLSLVIGGFTLNLNWGTFGKAVVTACCKGGDAGGYGW